MKILVTGGCGMIGSHLVDRLHFDGHQVTVLDSMYGAPLSNLFTPVQVVRGGTHNYGTLEEVIRDQNMVFHLAALSGGVSGDLLNQINVDLMGTLNVLRLAYKHSLGHVVLASSAGTVVGDVAGEITESLPSAPKSTYGATKAAIEAYGHAFSHELGLAVTILRFSNVFGPSSDHKANLVPNMMRAVLEGTPLEVRGDGSALRDYVYVKDVVEALSKTITYRPQGVFNISSGRSLTIMEMVAATSKVTGFKVPLRHVAPWQQEVRNVEVSFAKAIDGLNYYPDWPIEQGLKETWDWFCNE